MQDFRNPTTGQPLTRLAAALALGLAAMAGAQAQSLEELYNAARAYDASYLSARALSETAQAKLEQAQSTARPSLGVGVTSQYQSAGVPPGENPANQAAASGASGTTPAAGTTTESIPSLSSITTLTSTLGLNAKMAVYNRANSVGIEQAQRALGTYSADLETAEQDLIVRVAQAYFDVLAAQDSLSTSQANKKAIAEQLASAKRNFEVGTSTITDTREAQARFDLATAQEIQADNDLRTKQVVLDQIVGHVGVTPKPLLQPVALPALPTDDINRWISDAEQNPSVLKARLGLDIAHLEVEKQRANGGLTVDATGSLAVQNVRNNLPAVYSSEYGAGTTRIGTVGLSITLPVYTGGLVHGKTVEALKLEEKARDDLEFARRSAIQATRSYFVGVQSLQAQVKAYEAAESSSQLALEATQLGYKVGVRVNLDVLNAENQLYTTEASLAKARYDTIVNGLKLRQAAGTLQAGDISAVNALLAK